MEEHVLGMERPRVSAIAAIGAQSRALGRGNDLIWKIPEDLARFKRITEGHVVVMGRKTFESIGRALPNRTNIVITRDTGYSAPGCTVAHSLEEALEKARAVEREEIFIIGGGNIFEAVLPHTERLYLTLVDSDEGGDVYFPAYERAFTRVVGCEEHETESGLRYSYVTLER